MLPYIHTINHEWATAGRVAQIIPTKRFRMWHNETRYSGLYTLNLEMGSLLILSMESVVTPFSVLHRDLTATEELE